MVPKTSNQPLFHQKHEFAQNKQNFIFQMGSHKGNRNHFSLRPLIIDKPGKSTTLGSSKHGPSNWWTCRTAWSTPTVRTAQRPDRPQKIVTVHAQTRRRTMNIPSLRKTMQISYLPATSVSILAGHGHFFVPNAVFGTILTQ